MSNGLFRSILWPRISKCTHLFAANYLNTTGPNTQTALFTGQHGSGVQMRVTCWLWFAIRLIGQNFSCQCGLWIAPQRGLCTRPFNDPCWPYVFNPWKNHFYPDHPVSPLDIWGASLVLTGVLCHGHGLFLFLTSREGMSAGSNWNWECDSCLQIKSSWKGICTKQCEISNFVRDSRVWSSSWYLSLVTH